MGQREVLTVHTFSVLSCRELFFYLKKLFIHSTTISKFESKNSQEYHVVCNGATNRPVEKGLLICTSEYFKKLKFQLFEILTSANLSFSNWKRKTVWLLTDNTSMKKFAWDPCTFPWLLLWILLRDMGISYHLLLRQPHCFSYRLLTRKNFSSIIPSGFRFLSRSFRL